MLNPADQDTGTSQSPGRSRLREIFLEAVEIVDPGERATFLERACGGDSILRQRLERLLAADDGGVHEARSNDGLGAIGPYRLLEKIGEGGWGTVYLAEQVKPLQRRVAVKVIKLGMDSRGVLARFETERETLARMDHPNIARVLDAGTAERGRPYVVMEWVPGVIITRFAEERELTTRQRIELFLQVCAAVEHAHQKGIIHRDLKPSNVLVAADRESAWNGSPKIIDFGIAKAVDDQLSNHTFTALGQFVGTPAYMSPEQAEGKSRDVDTRTDIYSLGVLLYELLTGATPFHAEELLKAGLDGMRRIIREREPRPPSTVRAPRGQQGSSVSAAASADPLPRSAIATDIDWIVIKCLEKDRARRYETVSALAEDLRHYLQEEPINARPPSATYKAGKWIRRHKSAFAASCIAVISLVTGLALALGALRLESRIRRSESNKAYLADMRLAHRELIDGNRLRAIQLLQDHVPAPGKEDYRCWEWHQMTAECAEDESLALGAESNRVTSVLFLDNHRLLTAGVDAPKLWDCESKRLVRSFGGFRDVLNLLYAPGRHGFYSRSRWGAPQAANFFDLEHEESERLENFGPVGMMMALSSDESWLALSRPDESGLTFWNTRSETIASTFKPPDGQVNAVAFLPGQPVVLAAVGAGRIHFFDVVQGKMTRTLSDDFPPDEEITRLTFSPNGETLITIAGMNHPAIWNLSLGRVLTRMESANGIVAAAFSADGKHLALGGQRGKIHLVNATNWVTERLLRSNSEVEALAFSPDGLKLASTSRSGEIKVWPLETLLRVEPVFRFERAANFTCISSDGLFAGRAIFLGAKTEVEVWDLAKRTLLYTGQCYRTQGGLLPGGQMIYAKVPEGTVELRRLARNEVVQKKLFAEIFQLNASGDGKTLFTAGRRQMDGDWEVTAFSLPELARLRSSPIGLRFINAVSDDGEKVMISNGHGGLEVLSGESMQSQRKWTPYPGAENIVGTFSVDKRKLATACSNGERHVWDLADPRRDIHLPLTGSDVTSLAFSPDGRRLALAAPPELKLYDVATGEEVWSTKLPELHGVEVKFTHDGKQLVAVGSEGLKIWSAVVEKVHEHGKNGE